MSPLRPRRGGGAGSSEPDDGLPRSENERERARQEREARRAEREGRVPEPLPPVALDAFGNPSGHPATVDPIPEPVEDAPQPVAPSPPPPPPAQPVQPAWFEPTGPPGGSAAKPVPEVFPPASANRLARLSATERPAPPASAVAEPPGAADDLPFTPFERPAPPAPGPDDDVPLGPRRVRPGRSGGVIDAARRGPRRPRRLRARIAGLLFIAVVVVLAWFANGLLQPFHGTAHGSVVVVIPPSSSTSQIGTILEHDGVIPSSFFFRLRARLSGKSADLHPGRYVMKRDMTYADAITQLNTAPKAAAVIELTLPEGLSIREANPTVKRAGLRGSYLDETAKSKLLTPRFYGAPKKTHSLEGFLFPATYELRRHASVGTLIHKQVNAFRHALKSVSLSYSHSKHLSPYDVLTIASMVERESASAHDRPLIAAVIYNRLHDRMPLGIDATLRFALNDWDKPLTVSQLHTNTPYNTRIHTGLPPTPIGSPGLAAIQAAAHPAHVSYLYYVANSNGCGGTVFSTSADKFNHDVALYQAAVAANHGRVPTCKH